ncbi:MAG: dihydroneopterin aldolase [Ignavibacteria bacterium]|nr:dihydroneopterin aldolase [Ignavibacteria bacterium]
MKVTHLTKLSLRGIKFYAYHGVKKSEKDVGGKYEVDLDLYYDATNAIIHDDVKFAVNYEEAVDIISDIISEESYNLIETLASEILNLLMEKFEYLQKATIKVRKISVPIKNYTDYVEAEHTIERK